MTDQDFSLPDGTHTVAMGLGDLNGILRGKRFPASQWDRVCKGGNAVCASTFAMDMTCDVWDTPYVNFANGYPDMHLFPMTQPVALPWEPGVAICLARAEGMDHKPVPIDPRQALILQVERATAMGLRIDVGCEVEFYLLDPETNQPKDTGIGVYGLDRAAELEHVIGPIRQMINDIGIPIEQSNPEYAAGQVEVNIRYADPLTSADNLVLFRSLVKQLAHAHGYRATFMAKPFYDTSGSGFHTHYSVWRGDKNVLSDNGKLSTAGRHFVAGLEQRIVETAICGTPTPNGYKRRQPYTFCPINATWGMDNRTTALRVIEGSESATRVEKRDASADANPYYVLAADIAAGLDGLEAKREPTPMTQGDAYALTGVPALPRNAQTAVAEARRSDWLRTVLGDDRFEILVQQAEREIEFVAAQITPTETKRYLRNL